jgi:hypothetical protein
VLLVFKLLVFKSNRRALEQNAAVLLMGAAIINGIDKALSGEYSRRWQACATPSLAKDRYAEVCAGTPIVQIYGQQSDNWNRSVTR